MCEEHEFVMPESLDEELETMLRNQTEKWNILKDQLDSTTEVKMNSPPPECASKQRVFLTSKAEAYCK